MSRGVSGNVEEDASWLFEVFGFLEMFILICCVVGVTADEVQNGDNVQLDVDCWRDATATKEVFIFL